MREVEQEQVKRAWGAALDRDVVRALDHPEDYPPEVYTIVQAEADQRQLCVDAADSFARAPSAETAPLLTRMRTVAAVVGRLPPSYPLLSACLLGIGVRALGPLALLILGEQAYQSWWWLVLIVCTAVYLACLVWICWPTRSYCGIVLVTFLVWICNTLAGVNDMRDALEYAPRRVVLHNLGGTLLYFAVGPSLLLWLVVFIRNRIWPVYALHQCAKCGYDLRGLPELRCPECGTPFVPATDDEAGGQDA